MTAVTLRHQVRRNSPVPRSGVLRDHILPPEVLGVDKRPVLSTTLNVI